MKLVHLTKGVSAKVDDSDFADVSNFKWYCLSGRKKYAARRNGKKITLMHRFLMKANENILIDHKNGDGLDNRRQNLREATRSQNQCNATSMIRKNNRSGYRGVTKHPKGINKPWRATIIVNWKQISLGYFKTKEDAAIAYNDAAKKYHGEFARLNNVELVEGMANG